MRMFLKTANWSEAPEAFSLVRDELTHQLQKAAEESSRTSPLRALRNCENRGTVEIEGLVAQHRQRCREEMWGMFWLSVDVKASFPTTH